MSKLAVNRSKVKNTSRAETSHHEIIEINKIKLTIALAVAEPLRTDRVALFALGREENQRRPSEKISGAAIESRNATTNSDNSQIMVSIVE